MIPLALLIPIHLIGLAVFCYICARRFRPLLRAQRDLRFDKPLVRLRRVLQFWLAQWKQPRYFFAGVLHIVIFAGFLILAFRSLSLVTMGLWPGLAVRYSGLAGELYGPIKDYTTTLVLIAVIAAAVRRAIFRPRRYSVPPQYGKGHTPEAILILAFVAGLMLSESLFEATSQNPANSIPPLSLAWFFGSITGNLRLSAIARLHSTSYLVHEITLLTFLCFLPFGKHFHVLTSLFNVYFAKVEQGVLKPVRWGVPEEQLDTLRYFGVKQFEDFTWKQVLDFYSCADCGRCSDNCPANSVGRPLSPRFLTIKARDYAFRSYPVFATSSRNGTPLVGNIYSEDEVWSCTTCGACEQECPLQVEYIDKVVDLRRGLVDEGAVPISIQKALKSVESRGNPYGKLEKKRADWAKNASFAALCEVKIANGNVSADTLYFVDSITSYDDRIQSIGRATARILKSAGEDFAILGAAEKDSGHEVRRFGEELLFMALRDHNLNSIKNSGARSIVTSDPHAYNALKHDYSGIPPVLHITEFIEKKLIAGSIRLRSVNGGTNTYAFHDPCYLGRHNNVYDAPRNVLDAVPGLKRVEMSRCRDRSFCCGGGGLMLFYEPKEEQRMGVKRVQMAAEAGANVIVTACPFCLVNLEDAIKVAGMERQMKAIDLAELINDHIEEDSRSATLDDALASRNA